MYKILIIIFVLVLNLSVSANELTNNSSIIDIYYDNGIADIDTTSKDRYYVQPIFTAVPNFLSLEPRDVQITSCIETEGAESCPIDIEKCNVNVSYYNGTATPVYKTISMKKSCLHGVYSDSESKCALPSKCNIGKGILSKTTGVKECFSDYYTSDGNINPQPVNKEEPFCEISGMGLNLEKTLCLEDKRCLNGYIENDDICKLNYHFYEYSCEASSSGFDDQPLIKGEDCLGSCGYNNCSCNSPTPPDRNCKNINGQCPLDGSIPCVAIPSDNGEFTIESSSYIYKPLVNRQVFGGFNSASINEDTGICEKKPCPYTIKHIISDGPRLKFFEENSVEIPQYVEVVGNNFFGSISGDISYIVVGDEHKTLSGYDMNGNLLGVISSVYRINGKVGFVDSEGFNVVSTEIESDEPNAFQNTLYFYNTFSDQYHKQGFLTFISEMDPSLADCTEDEKQIEQICALGSFNESGLCQEVMQNTFCYGSYELNSDEPGNPICKDTKQCVFGDYINKQDANTRLCSTYREIQESCAVGEILDEQGHCTYIQPKCRTDYRYVQQDDKCEKTLYSSANACKDGYSMLSIDPPTNMGRCVANQSCTKGTYLEDVNATTKICIIDEYHEEECPDGEVLIDRDGVSYCSYEKNVCSVGYFYNSIQERCEKILQEDPVDKCIDGRVFVDNGDGTGSCIERSQCSGGYWVENIDTTKRKCYIDATYNEKCENGEVLDANGRCYYEQKKCVYPYVFSAENNKCIKDFFQDISTSCSSGYFYNSVSSEESGKCIQNSSCSEGIWKENITDTKKICDISSSYSEQAPEGYSIFTDNGIFYIDKELCSIAGTSYNSNTGLCETSAEFSCVSSGYVFDQSSRVCEKQPVCPTDWSWNASKLTCEIDVDHTCPIDGYTYNSLTKRCEEALQCASGYTYNSNTKKCEQLNEAIATPVWGEIEESTAERVDTLVDSGSVTFENKTFPPQRAYFYTDNTYKNIGATQSSFNGFSAAANDTYGSLTYVTFLFGEEYEVTGMACDDNGKLFAIEPVATIPWYKCKKHVEMCPSGYEFNSDQTQCVRTVSVITSYTYSCSDGETLTSENECLAIKDPVCQASVDFDAIFDAKNDICFIPSQSFCPLGVVSADTTKCELEGDCGNGSLDNNGSCIENPDATCPVGTTLSFDKCVVSAANCVDESFKNKKILNSTTLRCSESLEHVCSSPVSQFAGVNENERVCFINEVKEEVCPSGETLDDLGRCNYVVQKCPSDYIFNAESQKCFKQIFSPIIESCQIEYSFEDVNKSSPNGRCSENNICQQNPADVLNAILSDNIRQCLNRASKIEECDPGNYLNHQGFCVRDENLCDQRVGTEFLWEAYNQGSGKCEKMVTTPGSTSCKTDYSQEQKISNDGIAVCIKKDSCLNGKFNDRVDDITVQCLVQAEEEETCPGGETLDDWGKCTYSENVCAIDYNYIISNQRCEKYIYESPAVDCYKKDYSFEDLQDGSARCTQNTGCDEGRFNRNLTLTTRLCTELTFHAEVCRDNEIMDNEGHCYYEMKDVNCPLNYEQKLINNQIVCVEKDYCVDEFGNKGRLIRKVNDNTRICQYDGSYTECRGDWNYENVEPYNMLLINNENIGIVAEAGEHTYTSTTERVTEEQCNDIAKKLNGTISQLGNLSEQVKENLKASILFNFNSVNDFNEAYCSKGQYSFNQNACLFCNKGETYADQKCLSCPATDTMMFYDDFAGTMSGYSTDRTILRTETVPLNGKVSFCKRYADYNGRYSASWSCVHGGEELRNDFVGDVNRDDDLDFKITIDGIDDEDITFCRRYADYNGRYSASWSCVHGGEALTTDFVGDVNRDDDLDFKIYVQERTDIYSPFGCFHSPLEGYYQYSANIGTFKSADILNGRTVFDQSNSGVLTSVNCKSNINALDLSCSIDNGANLKINALNNGINQVMNISVYYLKNGNIIEKDYPSIVGNFDAENTEEANLSIVNFSIDLVNTLIESNISIVEPNKENAEFGKSYCVIENSRKIGFNSTKNAKKEISATRYDYACSPFVCDNHQCGVASCGDGYNGAINDTNENDGIICIDNRCDVNKPYAEKCGLSQGCPDDDNTVIEDDNGVCFKMICDEKQGFNLNINNQTCDKLVCPDGYPIDNGDGTCSK